jgi:hypothetical protein
MEIAMRGDVKELLFSKSTPPLFVCALKRTSLDDDGVDEIRLLFL